MRFSLKVRNLNDFFLFEMHKSVKILLIYTIRSNGTINRQNRISENIGYNSGRVFIRHNIKLIL